MTLDWRIQDTPKFQHKLHPGTDIFCIQDLSDLENMFVKVGIDKDTNITNNIEINLETL